MRQEPDKVRQKRPFLNSVAKTALNWYKKRDIFYALCLFFYALCLFLHPFCYIFAFFSHLSALCLNLRPELDPATKNHVNWYPTWWVKNQVQFLAKNVKPDIVGQEPDKVRQKRPFLNSVAKTALNWYKKKRHFFCNLPVFLRTLSIFAPFCKKTMWIEHALCALCHLVKMHFA